ncbi:putative MFS-type transporter [Venturia inaequalis]|nr:putative MFS-type transporter [Venturia inaequalis]
MGYREQAEKLNSKAAPRTLQYHANKAGAKRFKKRYQTKISSKNQKLRKEYGLLHKRDTISELWQYIWFTDKAHFQSIKLAEVPEYELRYPGQEGGINKSKATHLDVTIHVSGGISYNHKGKLIFYKDPVKPVEKVRRQVKESKQLKYELDSVYQARLKVWQDLKAKESETPKGNYITQVFYAKNILPIYIQQVQALEQKHGVKYHLQEDGNPSHGINSPNSPPGILRRDAGLLILVHPPQSPDLNPIESCWNIMKARLAGRRWSTIAEFKAAIQAEWDKIQLVEIRYRIAEMPDRCKKIIKQPQVRIQSALW